MDFVTFEIAKKLKEKGFDYPCLFVYNKEQIINPEVVKAFGELSDDGYYELTKEGGGRLDWNFVYIYKHQLIPYRDVVFEREIIKAPAIYRVLKWLREEHHLHFEIVGAAYGYNLIISDTPDKGGTNRYYSHLNDDGPNYAGAWDGYDGCVLYGIEYVLDNLI